MGNISGKPHHRPRNKKQVRWKAADRPLPPGKPQFVPDAYSLPDVITLCWNPPKSDGGSPIDGYLVEHRRCGSTHWIKSTPLLISIPEVSLSGLDPGWRYQFRVSAENAVGMSMPSEISEPLTVTLQRSAVTAPRFTEELRDTVGLENEKIEFVVHYMGQPPPKISWFKDGFEIFSSRRTRILTDNDRSTLTIHQAALSDEGEIKCTATNRTGHASTRAILKLEAPPSIRLPRQYEEGLLFEIGEVVRLKVSVAGRPTPLVFWSHNGESLRNDERHEIENGDRFSTVKINEVVRSDRGEYQVKAVNKLGEDVSSFLVTITDKPSPPGRARVVMTLGRSVTLSWKSPEDDGGCKIGNYIIEYYRVGWDVWLKAATCRQLTTVLGDLIEGSEYKFRVKAESPYGISEPSEESDPVFIPDPRRGVMGQRSRAKSQPPDLLPNEYIAISYEPKMEPQPRSRSSSRTEKHVTISEITDVIPPVRPKRTKSKSAPQTPLQSPAVSRRQTNTSVIDKGMFDRASLARELAYGSPGMKTKRPEEIVANVGINNEQRPTSPIFKTQLHTKPPLHPNSENILKRPTSPPGNIQQHPQRPLSPNIDDQSKRNQAIQQNLSRPTSPAVSILRSPSPMENKQIIQQRPTSPPVDFNRNNSTQSPIIFQRPSVDSNRNNSVQSSIPTQGPMSSSADFHKNNSTQSSMTMQGSQTLKKSNEKLPVQQKLKSPSPTRKFVEERFTTTSGNNSSSNVESTNLPVEKGELQSKKSDIEPSLTTRGMRSFSKSPSPEFLPYKNKHERQRSPNKLDFMGSSKDRDDTNSGSTEFMLVLLPEEGPNGHRDLSDIRFDFDEVSVPPPLSLSAPELGAEPPQFELIRSASSTDILRELQMRRVFEAAAAEEDELRKRREEAKVAVEELKFDIPKIQINSKDPDSSLIERIPSFRRRLSGGSIPHHMLVSQKRQSLRGAALDNISENKIHKFEFSLEDKRELFKTRQRSGSQELEELEIEKARHKAGSERGNVPKKEIAVIDENVWEEESVEGSDEELSMSESNPSDEERYVKEKVPSRNIDVDEEPIYHPGRMLLKNSVKNTDKEPFEILTKPCPLPDPSFVPKPILKKRDDEKYAPDKPIRKDIEQKLHGISQNIFSVEHKQRSSSPRPPDHLNVERKSIASKAESFPTIEESKLERNLSPEPTKRRKSNEEIRAVADHYGDILRSYGNVKKTTPHLYLDRDELKAAAEEQSTENLEEIEKSVERLHVPNRKQFEGFGNVEEYQERSRSRTVSLSSDDGDRSLSQRRGSSSSSFSSIRQRRNSSTPDQPKSLKSRSRTRSLSKSSAHEENWSNLRAPPSPQAGRRASPSPQRRNSLTNPQPIHKQQRKVLREITTQTSGFDDHYLPYPRVPTPEQQLMLVQAEVKARSTIDYMTDLAMFFVACWLYLFHNELLAIPVLLIMVYRQLKEEIVKRLPKWMLPKKKQ
ncbi:muscle M-line assembly protein unc-89 isoform X2 [Agrilus planipennis]|uniref:Muscle M-line assembly protein unc-89 isoform X2 n=1 Tax=Agrilus planipennis TaxID=224129 RepID=A0A1W4XCH0_AGRPL|nr:muscle M-line assembly protein unc-89 isoform X2 [Agrilus planipennis]